METEGVSYNKPLQPFQSYAGIGKVSNIKRADVGLWLTGKRRFEKGKKLAGGVHKAWGIWYQRYLRYKKDSVQSLRRLRFVGFCESPL